MIKTAFCTALLAVTVTPALAENRGPDLSDPKVSALLMQLPNGDIARRPETCGTEQTPPALDPMLREAEPANALTEPQVIWLNTNGGTYTKTGVTSAANNTLGNSGGFKSGTIPPLDKNNYNWPVVVQCVQNAYKRFNVTVTETEPTSGPYVEAVVGGNEGLEVTNIGSLFGIAATDSFCSLFRTGIAFTFSGTHKQAFTNAAERSAELCNTIAHEVGHVLGLEHETLAKDHMSYVYIAQRTSSTVPAACPGTDPLACKSFIDQGSTCGTTSDDTNACVCGGASANSSMRLANFLGLRPTETTPPSLTLQSPDDFLHLPPTFDVTVTATDNMAMQDVSVLIDGVTAGSDTMPDGDTYIVRAMNVAEGDHTMVVRARDQALNVTEQTVQIRVKLAETGESCVDGTACEGGLCANSSEGQFCTETCQDNSCPDGFSCDPVGGTNICVPEDIGEGGGGCCSSSSGAGGGAAGLLTLGVGLVLARRRRR